MKSLSEKDEKFLKEMENDMEKKWGYRSIVEEELNNLKRKTDFIIACLIGSCFLIIGLCFAIVTYINMIIK